MNSRVEYQGLQLSYHFAALELGQRGIRFSLIDLRTSSMLSSEIRFSQRTILTQLHASISCCCRWSK